MTRCSITWGWPSSLGKNHAFYTSFSQGFDLPDVGLQLRNAGAKFDINASELEPVKTDNSEIGWRGSFGNPLATLALFQSRSDLGAVQSFNNGLHLTRTRERIRGVELTADGKTQFARADVKSYYHVDVVGRYPFDNKNQITVGVQNLFNRY